MVNHDLLLPGNTRKGPRAIVNVDGRGIHERRVVGPDVVDYINTQDVLGRQFMIIVDRRRAMFVFGSTSMDSLKVTRGKPKASGTVTLWYARKNSSVERRDVLVSLCLVSPGRAEKVSGRRNKSRAR